MTARSQFPVSRRWHANWIWADSTPERNAWVLFRQEFQLQNPTGLRLFITADTRYRLWINGKPVGDGPVQSQPYHQYYDEYALDDRLITGMNCIAVLVHYQGLQPDTHGGLLCEIEDEAGNTIVQTDGTWRTHIAHAWRNNMHFIALNKIGPFQEHVDLRSLPQKWTEPGFHDASWNTPCIIKDRIGRDRPPAVMPWCRLIPRDIAPLETHSTHPVALTCIEECLDLMNRNRNNDLSISLSQTGRPLDWATIENPDALFKEDGETILACSTRHHDRITDGRYDPCLTLDFGRILTAYAEIEIEAPAGTVVQIGYAERLVDGRFNNSMECAFADACTCAEGMTIYRPLVWRSFRYLRLRLKESESPVRLRAVRAIEVRYPFTEHGRFSGDTRLEDIFDICRNTLALCSIESIMDTPQREQAQWLGDVAAVTLPAILACYGDTALPGKFLRQAAVNTQPTGLISNISNVVNPRCTNDIPDYSLWWIMALWRFYTYSGDARYIHECYPEMQRIMRVHLERINTQGLIENMFGWVFIDWADIDRGGVCAAYNAVFAGACDAAAHIARFKGDTWAANQYETAAKTIRATFAPALLDPAAGVVADCAEDGILSPKISEHANAAAVAFNCLDTETAETIVRRIFIDRACPATEAQPFFMVVVLEALRRTGHIDTALRLIRERWGRMLDRNQTTCSEEWYSNGSWRDGHWKGVMRTRSHAWSACPAEFLITGLAGIEILEPGCARLRISPYAADFSYAVTYPTPHGNVHVNWNGNTASIQAPPSIKIEQQSDFPLSLSSSCRSC